MPWWRQLWQAVVEDVHHWAAIDEALDPPASRVRLIPLTVSRRGLAVAALVVGGAAVIATVSPTAALVGGALSAAGGLAAFVGAPKPTADGIFTQHHTNLGRRIGRALTGCGLALLAAAAISAIVS